VLDENVDEDALALEAAHKYVRKVQGLEWQDFRQKLGGFLGRRGFSYGVTSQVIQQVWAELHPGGNKTYFDNEETL
jgi:regulatory protein